MKRLEKLVYFFLLEIPFLGVLIFKFLYPTLKVMPGVKIWTKGRFVHNNNSIHRNSKIYIHKESTLVLKRDAWISDNVVLETIPGGYMEIGKRTSLESRCRLIGDIIVGDNVLFAPNVFASSGTHCYDYDPYLPIREQDKRVQMEKIDVGRRISIGDDCWIGVNVVIMRGVFIGKGSIIGANSVVTKDVQPYSVVAGSPARKIKARIDFEPPLFIDAFNKTHLPYFYWGFESSNDGMLINEEAFAVMERKSSAKTLIVEGRVINGPGKIALQVTFNDSIFGENIDNPVFKITLDSSNCSTQKRVSIVPNAIQNRIGSSIYERHTVIHFSCKNANLDNPRLTIEKILLT